MMQGMSTTLLHGSYDSNQEHGAVIPPLYLSTTYTFGNDGGYEYSRSGNPTRHILEDTLARLDGGQYGLTYASGSAALVNVTSLLQKDEGILFSADAYGCTYRFVTRVMAKQGLKYYVADLTDPQATAQLLKSQHIKVVWIETPTNPLLKVTDIAALAKLAHEAGALLVVDNTFATPILQRPLEHGADIVAYSTTKYINGHSDSVGGSLIVKDKALYERLAFLQNAIGAMLSPFDAWLTLRGVRTLELRMQRHVQNAIAIADFLAAHAKVARVYYPGHFSGDQGSIVKKQMDAPGAMISIELTPEADPQKFLQALRLFPLAESLGGVESLIDHPATMTHAAIPPAERKKIGLSDGLFRISVGIENQDDLLADLRHALKLS